MVKTAKISVFKCLDDGEVEFIQWGSQTAKCPVCGKPMVFEGEYEEGTT